MAILTPTLQLGPFMFSGFEEPEALTFGKEQSTYKHLLIGGGRIIDCLGAGDPDITWSGYFTGFQAQFRAQYIEGLVKSGQAVLLKTGTFVKNVVITKFNYGYHKVFPIQYTITVQVIQDETLPVSFIVPADITDTITNAMIQVNDIATLINNPSILSAAALALIAIDNASPFTSASNVQINAALAAALNVQSVVAGVISTTEQGIFS